MFGGNSDSRNIVRVVAVSPGDVLAERAALASVVDELNRRLAPSLGCTISLWRWETDARPGLHPEGGQGLIDEMMGLEAADLVFGVFWTRFGTPTHAAASGTEHELRRAWSAWQRHRKPDVMIYFCDRPAYPHTSDCIEQWKRVIDFRESLPDEQLWWAYTEVSDFERLAREHLTDHLLRRFGTRLESRATPSATAALDAPRFAAAVRRETLMAQFTEKACARPLVLVEGLPGSGKTFFIADYLTSRAIAGATPWFDPDHGATLDDLVTALSGRFKFAGVSATARSKELVRQLVERSLVLVLDDFQRVDKVSFAALIAAAADAPPPVRVIVASRNFVDVPSSVSAVGRFGIPGLEVPEVREMLARRGVVSMTENDVVDLVSKVDGLPIAVEVFSSLVVEFGRAPSDLLAGSMIASQRFREWFEELLSAVPDSAQRLLCFLSVATVPFNIGLVRMAGRSVAEPDPEGVLETLQRAYLVQAYSPYRWTVHQLIATLATNLRLHPQEINELHGVYAKYYSAGARGQRGRNIDDETFAGLVTACRHMQAGGQHEPAQSLLSRLAPAAKSSGKYDTLRTLCRVELQAAAFVDPWIGYHAAHCALIVGDLSEARRTAEGVVAASNDDGNLELSAARLIAEVALAEERAEEGLAVLRKALVQLEEQVRPTVRAQARLVEARLLAQSGDISAATEIAVELLAHAEHNQDRLGGAVALAQLGYLSLDEGDYDVAADRFTQAAELFREVRDQRGLSWSLLGIAEAELHRRRDRAGLGALNEALQIRSVTGEASREYLAGLQRIRVLLRPSSRPQLLDFEIARLSTTTS